MAAGPQPSDAWEGRIWPEGLPPAAATGVGSLPGADPLTAQRRVFDLLPFPHLVELPDRGPGADLVGRGAALLVDLPVDLQPAGWRLVDRPGSDLRRAQDLLRRDLDALAEAGDGWAGPLKVQAAGPWTLASRLELKRGDKALADRGAVADLAASLADGLATHVARVRALVPGARIATQLDEPMLPAVLTGRVPTASGFGALRTPEEQEVREVLATVLGGVPSAGVHCCAPEVPVGLLRTAGARWVALDVALLGDAGADAVGEGLESGLGFLLGFEPGAGTDEVVALARRLALDPAVWTAGTAYSPPCGLAGRDPAAAWEVLRRTAADARRVVEEVAG